jgi:hypothetical protein
MLELGVVAGYLDRKDRVGFRTPLHALIAPLSPVEQGECAGPTGTPPPTPPAQRTAVKLRPHPRNRSGIRKPRASPW